MNQIDIFEAVPPPRFRDAFSERATGNNNLILVLMLAFGAALVYFWHAVGIALTERHGIEPPSRIPYSSFALIFLWVWGHLLTMYAIIAAARLLKFAIHANTEVQKVRLTLPNRWILHWSSLVLYTFLWHLPPALLFIVLVALDPPQFDVHYGIVPLHEIYFATRITMWSLFTLCLFRVFGYARGLLLLVFAIVAKAFRWALISMAPFPEWMPSIMAIEEILLAVLPWGLGLTWPMNVEVLNDSSQWTAAGYCILQNLAYSAVAFYLLSRMGRTSNPTSEDAAPAPAQ